MPLINLSGLGWEGRVFTAFFLSLWGRSEAGKREGGGTWNVPYPLRICTSCLALLAAHTHTQTDRDRETDPQTHSARAPSAPSVAPRTLTSRQLKDGSYDIFSTVRSVFGVYVVPLTPSKLPRTLESRREEPEPAHRQGRLKVASFGPCVRAACCHWGWRTGIWGGAYRRERASVSVADAQST